MPEKQLGDVERSPAPYEWAPSEVRWLRRSVRLLGLSLSVGLLCALGVAWMVARFQVLPLIGAELVVVVLALWLNRRLPPQWPARLIAISLPLMSTGIIVTGRLGLRDVVILVYPACLIVAGLLLDRGTLAVLTATTVACMAVVAFREATTPADPLPGPLAALYFVDATIILTITAIGVGLVAGHLRRAFADLQSREASLREANVALARQAERLRTSESRYRELIDLAADAILVEDPTGLITHVNDQACQLTGRKTEDLLGGSIEALFSPTEIAHTEGGNDPLARGRTVVEERRLLRADGTTVPVEVSSKGMPDGSRQAIIRDVAERKRAEAERMALKSRLHQSQKMAAIGRLAGGVAHDFNNLITAITSSLTMAMRHVPETERAHRWLKEVDSAAWRAAALTRQLLSFGQRQAAPKEVDLCDLVRGLQPVLAQLLGDHITLEVHLPAAPCPVSVDPEQVERAVINLAANARDAMPDGGLFTISMSRLEAAEVYAVHPEARSCPYVALSASDTGRGLDPRVREHLFEPFVTTKASGEGTGLGLAIVHAAVEQNKGFIDVASTPGQGTTFRMHFPLAGEEGAA